MIKNEEQTNKNEEIKHYIRGNANSTNLVRNLSHLSLSFEHNIETYDRVRY